MPTIDQALGCAQGDTFNFAITLGPSADGSVPNLSGASAVWFLMDGNYQGATNLITKTGANAIVNQDDSGNWQVVVGLDPADTVSVPPGTYYHQCKVTLANTDVSHIEGGPFVLGFAGIP